MTPTVLPPDAPLPDEPALLQQMIRELLTQLRARDRELEQIQTRLDLLLRRLYGPRSEQRPGPGLFDAMTPVADPPAPVPPEPPSPEAAPARRRGHGRRKLPANLRRERVEHDLSEAEKLCPCCQMPRVRIGEEISERLDFVPASLFVVEHIRPKYICRACIGEIAVAALPAEPITKSLAAPGLLAHVIVSKHVDHLPLNRQEKIFARQGLDLSRSTLCDWMAGCAAVLRPLYLLLCSHVLLSKIIHTDDTPVRLLADADGELRTGRVWVYLGDADHPYTVYAATSSRSRDGPATFLQGFKGYLQADAFGGYDGLYAQGVTEVACWAHARRKFVEAEGTDAARAAEGVARIRALYDIETRARELPAAERAALRQREAAPLLQVFGDWLRRLQHEVLPKSVLGQAVTYVRNQWAALNVYVTNGDLAIDNNVAERALRGIAVGRKNWLFFASEVGGHTAAVLTSFTATCQRHGINPWLYLKDVLTRIPTCPADQLPTLLPDQWAAAQRAASA